MLSLLKSEKKQKVPTIQVSDLDALVLEPVTVKLHGKDHLLNPVDTITYLKFTNELHKFYNEDIEYTPDEFVKRVHSMVTPLIPSIAEKDIKECSQTQLGALFNLCLNAVTGKLHTQAADEKKKPLTEPR